MIERTIVETCEAALLLIVTESTYYKQLAAWQFININCIDSLTSTKISRNIY